MTERTSLAKLEMDVIKAMSYEILIDRADLRKPLAESGLEPGDFEISELGVLFGYISEKVTSIQAFDVVEAGDALAGKVRTRVLMEATNSELIVKGSFLARARVLKDSSTRRSVVASLGAALAAASGGGDLGSALAEGKKAIDLATSAKQHHRSGADFLTSFVDDLERVQLGLVEPIIATGIHPLDSVIGGLQNTLTIIGSAPGIGKSALAATIIRNLTRRRVHVGLFSLEDEGKWILRRLVSESASVPVFVLGTRKLSDNQMDRVGESFRQNLDGMSFLHIDDRPAMSTSDVVSAARSMIVKYGVKVLVVDHLGEIRLERTDRHDLDISEALSELRALSKVYGVAMVVLCHIRRKEGSWTPKDEPRLQDFAFSAAVERKARVALGLSRPDEDTLRVSVLKQTNGQAGVAIDLPFRGAAGMVGNGTRLSEPDAHYGKQEAEMRGWNEDN